MKDSVIVNQVSHSKMVLHAVRRSRTPIHGILLGNFSEGSLTVLDVLPICHSTPTKPIVDMSLRLAEAHCESMEGGIGIVGWYTANQRLGDDAPGPVALKITQSIAANVSNDSILITITGSGLEAKLLQEESINSEQGFDVYGSDNSKNWVKKYPADAVSSANGSWEISKGICASDAESVPFFDFEDHLDGGVDLTKERDWIRNHDVVKAVQRA